MKLAVKIILLINMIIFHLGKVYAQLPYYTPDNFVFSGTQNVAQSIIVDTFNPLTHFKQNDFNVYVMPIYMNIETLRRFENASSLRTLDGDGFNGYAIGITINYAITNNWYINLSGVYAKFKGDLTSKNLNFSSGALLVSKLNGETITQSYNIGLGYDLMRLFKDSGNISIPITGGIFYRNITGEFDCKPDNTAIPTTRLNGDTSYYNYFIVLAASYKFSLFDLYFKITPYLYNFFVYDVKYTTTIINDPSNPLNNGKVYNGIDHPPKELLPGLSLAYISQSSFSFSLSISGVLFSRTNYYNDAFLESLKTQTYSFAVSYNTNFGNN